MHLKRNQASKLWPIPRKGTKYLVVPRRNKRENLPLIIGLRDLLVLVRRRKQLKKILHEGKIKVNSKVVKDDKYSLSLFDKVSIESINKYYAVNFSPKGKLILEEVNEKDSHNKISKVINKKMLKGKKVQINFLDGINVISNEKISVGDSALYNFKSRKIEKALPIRENCKVIIIKGKHRGSYGKIFKINDKKIIIKSQESEFETKNSDLMAID